MAKFIKRSKLVETVSYTRCFNYKGHDGWGFGFPSDENGNVDKASLNPAALENYEKCLTGTVDDREVTDAGVRKSVNRYREPAVIECACGKQVTLDHDGAECDRCHLTYNLSGQTLAPREQWGEETGEHPADIEQGFINHDQ